MPNLLLLFPVLSVAGAIATILIAGKVTWWTALAFFGVPLVLVAVLLVAMKLGISSALTGKGKTSPVSNKVEKTDS